MNSMCRSRTPNYLHAPPALTSNIALYRPFSEVTRTSLQHALAESGVTLKDAYIEELMKAYDSLGTFQDVAPALNAIKSNPSIEAYVFSNGTDSMVSSSVNNSPSLGPYSKIFKGLITVEEVRCYKPHPNVYQHLAQKVGKTTSKEDMATIWLVSGNPFDIVGARAAGMQAAWVDRAGRHHGEGGWTDRLGDLASGGPTRVVGGVDEAVREINKWTEGDSWKRGAGHNKEEAALGPG
jgi:2-haloacid dehalogenase